MEKLQLINQFVDVLLYAWLTLIMFRRVVCRNIICTPKAIFTRRKLIKNTLYYSDVLLLIMSTITVCILSNEIVSYTSGITNSIDRSIPWMGYHKLVTLALIVKYKSSQPKIFNEFIKDIKRYYYDHVNNFWKRRN